jgi:hypothetical protein
MLIPGSMPLSPYSDAPFGRFKNRAMRNLLADRVYCRWLLHQPWFLPQWPEVYALVAAAWPVEELLQEPLRSGKSFRRGDSFKRPGYRIGGKPAERDSSELCLARTRNGGRCQRKKAPGKKRCVQHGGHPRAGRPRGLPQHPNTGAALKRWYARMWALKNAGKISRFPQGGWNRKAATEVTPAEPPKMPIALQQMAAGLREKAEEQRRAVLREEQRRAFISAAEDRRWPEMAEWLGRPPKSTSQPLSAMPAHRRRSR